MPYKMETTDINGTVILSPIIAPNSNNTEFGYDDRRIEREIKKVGKSMLRHKIIESFKVVSV